MSTWTDVSTYIKTQLKPGVLGNTNVQKILNAVLAIVNQINAGSIDPENDSLWKADVSYPADTTPVLWMDNWLVSNIDDNKGNVPVSIAGVVHPTWRIIGSSVGSGIRIWEPIVYPNVLEIVFQAGSIYYLNREVVGTDPFVSVNFTNEVADGKWIMLTGGDGSDGGSFRIIGKLNDPSELPATGTFGDGYLINGHLWVWTGAAYEDMGSIQGPKGDQGIQGVKGDKGDQGIQGVKGDQGEQGIQGVKGDQGIKGDQGENGIQGVKGDQGIKGDKGDSGVANSYYEEFTPAVSVWIMNHNFGRRPGGYIARDNSGNQIFGTPDWPTLNQFTLTFPGPVSGDISLI